MFKLHKNPWEMTQSYLRWILNWRSTCWMPFRDRCKNQSAKKNTNNEQPLSSFGLQFRTQLLTPNLHTTWSSLFFLTKAAMIDIVSRSVSEFWTDKTTEQHITVTDSSGTSEPMCYSSEPVYSSLQTDLPNVVTAAYGINTSSPNHWKCWEVRKRPCPRLTHAALQL
jgi:hypothetical protein